MTKSTLAEKTCTDTAGTAAFLESILHMVLPHICKNISRSMIQDPELTILRNEEPLTDEAGTVLRDIGFECASIRLVDAATLQADVEQMPSFAWPEKDRIAELMEKNALTILDIDALTLKLLLGQGIEFAFPVVNSFGQTVTLEVGCGGDTIGQDAYFELHLPKVRLWVVMNEQRENFVSTQQVVYTKVYAAFLGRPDLTPHVHINADRGKGDFFELDLHESGSLDEVVENILMGFGPTEFYDKDDTKKKETKRKTAKESWMGNALGKQISSLLGRFVEMGDNRPYELDLTEGITQSFSGKPRQLKDIKADIDNLKLEMEAAQKYYDEHPDEVIPEEKEEQDGDKK